MWASVRLGSKDYISLLAPKSEKQVFKRLLRNSTLQQTVSDAGVRILTQCKKLKGKVWANLSWGEKIPQNVKSPSSYWESGPWSSKDMIYFFFYCSVHLKWCLSSPPGIWGKVLGKANEQIKGFSQPLSLQSQRWICLNWIFKWCDFSPITCKI